MLYHALPLKRFRGSQLQADQHQLQLLRRGGGGGGVIGGKPFLTLTNLATRDAEADSFHSAAMQQLRSLNNELGISLQGDPSPEIILRDLDPQSMILCGLSPGGKNNNGNCGHSPVKNSSWPQQHKEQRNVNNNSSSSSNGNTNQKQRLLQST